jgi:hypothetical protein
VHREGTQRKAEQKSTNTKGRKGAKVFILFGFPSLSFAFLRFPSRPLRCMVLTLVTPKAVMAQPVMRHVSSAVTT